MSDAYRVSGANVEFASGAVRTFEHGVSEVLEFPESLVVLLTPPPKVHYPLNVFGLSKAGRVLWRVAAQKGLTSGYAGLIRRGDDCVRLANWDGILVDVHPVTGRVLHQEWGK